MSQENATHPPTVPHPISPACIKHLIPPPHQAAHDVPPSVLHDASSAS